MISTTVFSSFNICTSLDIVAENPRPLRISSSSSDSPSFQREIIARIVNQTLGEKKYAPEDIVSLTFNTTFDWSDGCLQRWLSQIGSMGQGNLKINVAINPVGTTRDLSRGLTTQTTIIIAIVVGVIFLIIMGIIIFVIWRRSKKKPAVYLGPTGYPTPFLS